MIDPYNEDIFAVIPVPWLLICPKPRTPPFRLKVEERPGGNSNLECIRVRKVNLSALVNNTWFGT